MPAIDGLAEKLAQFSFRFDQVSVTHSSVACASYPGGARPSSTVALRAGGVVGCGEHVGWTDAEHRRFFETSTALRGAKMTLGEWAVRLRQLPAYDRAALEAAAIDLAFRQHGTNLFRVAGIEPRPVRYAVSFARSADPVAEAHAMSAEELPLKVDADPEWTDETWARLEALGTVAVVDFKLDGDQPALERAAMYLPDAWIEDPAPCDGPWPPAVAARYSADAAVTDASALGRLAPRPAAINVKPARIGSVIEAIRCLERSAMLGVAAYVGGMFEVGIGRRQLLALAAVACPDGPNDIAPLTSETPRPLRLAVDADAIGFGDPA